MSNSEKTYNCTLALAGIFQAAVLAKQIANTGHCKAEALVASLNSIYIVEPSDVASVFNGAHSLQLGLNQLITIFNKPKDPSHTEVIRYVLGLIYLERKLKNNPKMLQIIGERIERSKQQLKFFEVTHPNTLANLADIYSSTVSTLKPRIQIVGKKELLTQPATLEKIRALLLAGIRAAVLWQQVGGSRWQLLVGRTKLNHMASKILNDEHI